MTDWIGGFAKLAKAYPNAKPAVEFRQRTPRIGRCGSGNLATAVSPIRQSEKNCILFVSINSFHASRKPVASGRAATLYHEFTEAVPQADLEKLLATAIKSNSSDPVRLFVLCRNWADAFLQTHEKSDEVDPARYYIDELAWIILSGGDSTVSRRQGGNCDDARRNGGKATRAFRVEKMPVHYHEMLSRVHHYWEDVVPRFKDLHSTKNTVGRRRT